MKRLTIGLSKERSDVLVYPAQEERSLAYARHLKVELEQEQEQERDVGMFDEEDDIIVREVEQKEKSAQELELAMRALAWVGEPTIVVPPDMAEEQEVADREQQVDHNYVAQADQTRTDLFYVSYRLENVHC